MVNAIDKKPLILTCCWIVGLIAVQIYLSFYLYYYSEIRLEGGEYVFYFVVRQYVWIVNIVSICAYIVALSYYTCVLRGRKRQEIQRILTILFLFVSLGIIAAATAVLIMYNDKVGYILVPMACTDGVTLVALLLCCDCWRDRNENVEDLENDPMLNQVVEVRMDLRDVNLENQRLEAELSELQYYNKSQHRAEATV
jgi:vacuolar-type H+-ATPase subunit I/STV1